MITFVNQDKRFEAVTYMIVDRKPYSSCEEMLKDIRYELFGYSKKDAERVVQMAKLIGRLGLNNEMLALKVIRLSKPVLDKGDLCYCQQFMMSD